MHIFCQCFLRVEPGDDDDDDDDDDAVAANRQEQYRE